MWQTSTVLKAVGISGPSWREMPLLRSISNYVGGELNSPLPLSTALSIYSLFECSLWSAHLFLKLIIGSRKLAYLHLAFRTTESHKQKKNPHCTLLCVCICLCFKERQKLCVFVHLWVPKAFFYWIFLNCMIDIHSSLCGNSYVPRAGNLCMVSSF